jgi:hypothetical protein
MAGTLDPLVRDLVEWLAKAPRPYAEVLDVWRTSCPRLTVWEDAVDLGYVERKTVTGKGTWVSVTKAGHDFLHRSARH